MATRRCSIVATCDQWVRASHDGTAVGGAPAALTLSWQDPDPGSAAEDGACLARGLAVDRLCRTYQLSRDTLERLVIGPTAAGLDYARLPPPVTIIGGQRRRSVTAEFQPTPEPELIDATGIAIDADDRLFLADRGRRLIAVIDLWSRRTLRVIGTAAAGSPQRYPMGLATDGRGVLAVVRQPAGLLRLTATRGPHEVALPGAGELPPGSEPSRVAVLPDGDAVVLWHAPDGSGWLAAGHRPPVPLGAASDIAVDAEGALVVAPRTGPSASLRRLVPTASGWIRSLPLDARGYDGSGIVVTADGRIGYWSAAGFRLAVRGQVRYAREGVCITYRLDSGVPRNQWGRVILDACLPPGTDCRIATVSTDDEFETAITATPALPAACEPAARSTTPALPPAELLVTQDQVVAPLHRRRDAPTPWWRPAPGDRVDLFEAPVLAQPGRYLWVTLRLSGDGRATPVIRELRVEHQAHDLVRRLPAVFTENEAEPSFLRRYLALFDGLIQDLDLRCACRDLLVDPASAPIETLDWLASFFGLLLDDRWHETARRQLVAEIVPLYRRRGTVWALSRYIELFLAGPAAGEGPTGLAPVIVEHFRLRGAGGPVLGAAHRFSVLVTRPLGIEQDAAIRHILDTERPAHTDYELCTVDAGMRVGNGLHLGLSSVVGPTGAFEAAITGTSLLGRGTLLGGATTGLSVEAARLGTTSRVG